MRAPIVTRSLLVVFILTVASTSVTVRAVNESTAEQMKQDNGLTQLFNSAMSAFGNGDYATAVDGMEKVIANAPPGSPLEAVYFSLGAAYFNLGQYPKAAETLRTYRTKFPAGARIAEATFSLGEASLLAHDSNGAVEAFKSLESAPLYRERALYYEGVAQKESGQVDAAISTLEKLVAPGLRSNFILNGALQLANLYAQKKQSARALALIKQIGNHIELLDNIVQLNTLTIQTGDSLFAQQLPKEALACYRVVRSHAEVIRLQTNRIADMRLALLRSVAAMRANPKNAAEYLPVNSQLKKALADAVQNLTDFQKLPNFEPQLFIRLATCLSEMNLSWEAAVAYGEVRRRFPDDTVTREPALYGLITASANAGRPAKTQGFCEAYLKEFPKGPNADSVGYLEGAVALQANDARGAETCFGRMLESQPQSSYRERMKFLLGTAQFGLGEYDKAQATYTEYKTQYAHGESVEEATYRIALCAVFSGAYEKGMGLLNAYLKSYLKGDFVPDARYRLAVCLYAASQNDEVIAACQSWEKDYGQKASLLGEVLALEADALAAKDDNKPAIETYLRACRAATTDEVSDYAIFAAQKLLQKASNWARISEIFKEFVHDHPDRPSAVMAIYWIGKAQTHEGKTEEAKHFIADTIKKYISDPKREAVEQLLTQLATLCVHKKSALPTPAPSPSGSPAALAEASASPAPSPSGSPAPSPAATPLASPMVADAAPSATPAVADETPPSDPGAELDDLLGGAETEASPLARARVLFAKAELARLRRQATVADQIQEKIATQFKPDELDAPLLATTGDYQLSKGHYDQAAPLYNELMGVYPQSSFLEFAYNGLGEIAYQHKDYPKALKFFTDAVDKVGAAAKLKEVMLGKARTLFEMGRFDEAKSIYEQVASTREWRGDSTAYAVFSLGEIMRKQGKLSEAIVYYQRVYVAYQRFLPWVAKAYVASAECFDQLGKHEDALNTYREMLKNPKLQDFSESESARKYLQKVGQG